LTEKFVDRLKPPMKSFKLDSTIPTHAITIVIAWSALTGLIFLIGFHIWVLHIRDHGWYLAADPSPHHWTRSRALTFCIGSIAGSLIGLIHAIARGYRNRCRTRRST
jgi:hypothetical protein